MSKKPKVSEKAQKASDVSIEVVKNMTKDELDYIADKNPCLRGMLTGYIYEYHLEKFLRGIDGVTDVFKPDDHDRERNKADFIVTRYGKKIRVQSKSIQTDSIREKNGFFTATVQNDSSDRHKITLPNGHIVECANYVYGCYDILAVCMVNFTNKMDFCFKLNSECRPCGKSKIISPEDRRYLMKTTEKITYPLDDNWSTDIVEVMNRVEENHKIKNPISTVEQMFMNL